jgi:rSAM/selenodomain-associated transferase 1
VATRPTLILFARTPALGKVKTRLSPPLSQESVLSLYVAFLEDAARVYGSCPRWACLLAAEPEPDDSVFLRIFGPPWRRQGQAGGDLGTKLTHSFEAELARGAPAVLAVGSDHPALPLAQVAEAFDAIVAGSDAAIVPAQDGGYCAIALSRRAEPALVFRDVPWSTPEALAVTRARIESAGLALAILATAYDVDRPEDLTRLRRDLEGRDPSGPDFPRSTARALSALDWEIPS